ncbi:endonuclease domain-containing 1 protein [Clupea harengus]|uniref:Endonuclease domain-containing 1 protein n=1 Tax=Clupea harengus TaxID=7950 RepID=A0A6P8GT43_CLUHA|nr:endonuclease domain-containing 1 protein [Clupea harengus]
MAAFSMKTCLVLLVISPLLSLARVTTFSQCPDFFVNGVSPTVLRDPSNNNRYQQICQCLPDQNGRAQYFYATLYDTQNKIPVYSAYTLSHADIDRDDRWYVEPQIDGGKTECMGGQNQIPMSNRGQRQALKRDYDGSGHDKGHLFPVFHTSTTGAMLATSTLTNAAPQDPTFNRGRWRIHEEEVVELAEDCLEAFMVTGVVPGSGHIGDGVRVAKYYWSALCCLKEEGHRSRGFIGPDNNGQVQELSVKDLEKRLSRSDHFNTAFTVFRGGC